MRSRKYVYLDGLYSYIQKIAEMSLSTGKDIVIWGYSKGGVFLRYLLQEQDQRVHVAYIIDQYMQIPAYCEPRIYRSSILQYIDAQKFILLSTIKDYKSVRDYAQEFGFVDGRNLFDVRSNIGVSYIDYMSICNTDLDFSIVTQRDRPDIYTDSDISISTPFEMTSVDRIFGEISQLEDDIAFFDYGCGKGQILFYAYVHGINRISGIELVPEIVELAKRNMKELNVPAKVICGDATLYSDIDDINVFYFNNPFEGKIFEAVIAKVEESCRRRYRRIHIVYLNPHCHRQVVKNGMLKLKRQLYIDVGDPLANFYCNE